MRRTQQIGTQEEGERKKGGGRGRSGGILPKPCPKARPQTLEWWLCSALTLRALTEEPDTQGTHFLPRDDDRSALLDVLRPDTLVISSAAPSTEEIACDMDGQPKIPGGEGRNRGLVMWPHSALLLKRSRIYGRK